MPNPRRSLFGIPSRSPFPSKVTEELVPLMGGIHTDVPGIMLDTASSASMTNFLPLDGYLVPRSRISFPGASSSNFTSYTTIGGVFEFTEVNGVSNVWVSAGTYHGTFRNSPTFSAASFVSAGGIGSIGTNNPNTITTNQRWQYAPVYCSTNNQINVVMASNSLDTIMVGDVSTVGKPIFSYLTGAPRALSVAVFDNYVLAWNLYEGQRLVQRVRWSDRGDPSNWTTGISGFEDLVAAAGSGTAIVPMDDRILLFTDQQIWYGVEAQYPAQFQFQPLEIHSGCPYPATIQKTIDGLMFLDNSGQLRLIPRFAWVAPTILSSPIRELVKARISRNDETATSTGMWTWAYYDSVDFIYYLFVRNASDTFDTYAFNTRTKAWSIQDFSNATDGRALTAGAMVHYYGQTNAWGDPSPLLGGSDGDVYSMSSLLAKDEGKYVTTSDWRSKPLGGDYPGQEKTMMEVRFDYKALSASSATVSVSFDNGSTFPGTGYGLSLNTSSIVSEAIAYVYGSGRYPVIRWQSESTGYQLHRCHAVYRVGGR